ncbi:MAG: lipoate--protein ligase family protein [Armatimonadetes bacterium]|nr:lipoate--protein ligase family protein [Armatimonadota bacterium]
MAGEPGTTPHVAPPCRQHRPVWRLIWDTACEPAHNMALDAAILDCVAASLSPPTIRVYSWDRAAISVGRFQDARRTLHIGYCLQHGIPVVRRITGGRGVLHGSDLTVSIAAPETALSDGPLGVAAVHSVLLGGVSVGLERLGLRTSLGSARPLARGGGDCFATATCGDLVDGLGHKLAGAAQRRTGGAVLQQVSLPLRSGPHSPEHVFRGDRSERSQALCGASPVRVADALVAGLAATLGIEVAASAPNPMELARTEHHLASVIVDLAKLM